MLHKLSIMDVDIRLNFFFSCMTDVDIFIVCVPPIFHTNRNVKYTCPWSSNFSCDFQFCAYPIVF